jgi:hypothetical protein
MTSRLHEALAAGLSGAVFVATEDLQPRKASDAILAAVGTLTGVAKPCAGLRADRAS